MEKNTMQTNKKITLFLIPLVLIVLLLGCQMPQGPVKIVFPPDPAETPQSPDGTGIVERFQESAPQGPTMVESAIKLSKEHAELAAEATALRQKNQNLITENHRLKNQLAALEAQLQQTQTELAQANDLLIEMRIELNNWKFDVLSFRSEMRDAEKAQLEALLKILNILGAEVKEELAQAENTRSTAVSLSDSDRAQP
jgi:DNA anti-recombination protein RmuC